MGVCVGGKCVQEFDQVGVVGGVVGGLLWCVFVQCGDGLIELVGFVVVDEFFECGGQFGVVGVGCVCVGNWYLFGQCGGFVGVVQWMVVVVEYCYCWVEVGQCGWYVIYLWFVVGFYLQCVIVEDQCGLDLQYVVVGDVFDLLWWFFVVNLVVDFVECVLDFGWIVDLYVGFVDCQ